MKKRFLLVLALALLIAGILAAVGANAAESGTCGDGLTWTLDDEGTLTISGTGIMTSTPWRTDGYHDDDRGWCYESVKKAIINDGVRNLCDDAFRGCINLACVSLPESLLRIGNNAFVNCNLTTVTIPRTVTFVGSWTFGGCNQLGSVIVSDGNTSLVSVDGVLFTKDMTELIVYPAAKAGSEFIIPDSVTFVRDAAFYGCRNLVSLTGSCDIGNFAFGECSSLINMTFLQGSKHINPLAFFKCYELKNLVIPSSLTDIEENFEDCLSISNIKVVANNQSAVTHFKRRGFGYALELIPAPIHYCSVSAIDDKQYSGTAKEPEVSIYDADDRKHLKKDTDFTIQYSNNINAGEATVIISGMGNYTGTTTQTFNIKSAEINECSIEQIKEQTYTGKALKPDVKMTFNQNLKLKRNRDYTLSYKNNKQIGTATVIIQGKGNFTGQLKKTFTIIPQSVKLLSLQAGEETLTVKWKKGTNIDGYQIQFGTKKDFSDAGTFDVKKPKTTEKGLYLNKGNTYYIRIRTFKKVKGKLYYSEWSNVLKKKFK